MSTTHLLELLDFPSICFCMVCSDTRFEVDVHVMLSFSPA
uniref:Uncharacterized protein n=1 Tax=Arundo donax TaxID=35708 RepID=A0A0A9EGM7_ARUDO